jgi:hypothetical protein
MHMIAGYALCQRFQQRALMTDDYKIYVDAGMPATLNNGAGILNDYATLQVKLMGDGIFGKSFFGFRHKCGDASKQLHRRPRSPMPNLSPWNRRNTVRA